MAEPNNKYKTKRARLEEYYNNPNVQAYLAGIRFTETGGTDLNWNAKNPKSTARGPYQFLDSSQKDILNNWGVNAYSKDPKEVHLAALGLMAYKPQGLESIKRGDFKKADTMYNKYWTSLPGGAEPNVHTPKLKDVRTKELSRLTKPVAPKPVPAPEPGYWNEFMTGYNAPFNDPKTDYHIPIRLMSGLQELFGMTDYSSQKKAHGGRLTKEGKKIRKYGPRPDYMNQNPSGMTTGPITQRSIGNTPGGGYMAFGDGGNTAYESWYRYNTPEGREGLPDSYSDYDYQRYYNDAVRGVNPMEFDEVSQHFPDTYKYPWHPSFSDESIYYTNQKETPALSYNTKADWKEYTRSKRAKGGWVYPTNTNYARVSPNPVYRKGGYILPGHEYPSYANGGETELENVPVTYVTPANILNPRVTTPADFHVYQAPRTYVPGQNAAKGTAEPMVGMEDPIFNAALLGYGYATAPVRAFNRSIVPKNPAMGEPIGTAADVAKSYQLEKYGLKSEMSGFADPTFDFYQTGRHPNILGDKPLRKDLFTGSTDVPSFNSRLNDLRRSAVHGNYPMESNIKGPFNINRPTAVGSADPKLTRFRSYEPEELGFSRNTIGPFGTTRLSPMYKEAPRFPGSEVREMLPVDAMKLYREYYIPNKKGGAVTNQDSLGEDLFELVDPTGFSSWDDVKDAYNRTGLSWETTVEGLGALPVVGKFGKVIKGMKLGSDIFKEAKLSKALRAVDKATKVDQASDIIKTNSRSPVKNITWQIID